MNTLEQAQAMFAAADQCADSYKDEGRNHMAALVRNAFYRLPQDSAAILYRIVTCTGEYAPAPLGATENIGSCAP